MSLLHNEREEERDDAAQGESLTKGTSHIVWASLAATILVTVIISIYVVTGEKPPAATGTIVEVWAHPMHTVTPGFDAGGAPMPQDSFDQVLVFTRVQLHNQSKQPVFLYQIMTNAKLDNGIHSSYAAPMSDYNRVFVAYPELATWHRTALSPEVTIEPGQTQEGTFVTSFRMSKAQWEARKGLDFTFGFRYLPSLTLTPQVPVVEH